MAYWEVWEKLILNKPVTLQGKCKQEKNGGWKMETVLVQAGGTLSLPKKAYLLYMENLRFKAEIAIN